MRPLPKTKAQSAHLEDVREEEHEPGLHAAAQPDGGQDAQANPPHNVSGPGLQTVTACAQGHAKASECAYMHVGAPFGTHAHLMCTSSLPYRPYLKVADKGRGYDAWHNGMHVAPCDTHVSSHVHLLPPALPQSR